MLTALLAFVLSAPAGAAPALYGFTFPCWWHETCHDGSARQSLDELAATGARTVAFVPTWYMEGPYDSAIVPTLSTPTDETLRAMIRQAHARGLAVVLKPHVDHRQGGPRSGIRPKHPKAWFESYRLFIERYARIAEEERVGLFCVGTELATVAVYTEDWRRVIAGVRKVYKGKLTYAANWYDFWRVRFWDDLDMIGVDGYFPLLGESRESLTASWQVYLPALRALAQTTGKPLAFTEVGLSSQEGAALRPWDYGDFGPLDLEIQRLYLESFIDVFEPEPWFAGFVQWAWETNPEAGGLSDKSMTVQGKPALELLKDRFRRWNGRTQAAAPPLEAVALLEAPRSPWAP